MIPLILRLKKERHREIAKAQDLVVKELYNIIDKAILHGGTAIWRCYNGNRFSEDIDVYIPRDINKIDLFFKNLEKAGFIIEKKRIKENSLFSTLKLNDIFVRFEAVFKSANSILKDYESIDGNFIAVYTLTPETLIKEKINAYLGRYKIRDLYDIFFLLKYADNKELIKYDLKKLINNFKNSVDKEELKILILDGLIPDTNKMLEYIKSFI